MITMKVGSGAKGPVRFIFSDNVSETTVTVYGDDSSDAVRAKLQRVLELEGGEARAALGRQLAALEPPPTAAGVPVFGPLYDAEGAEKAVQEQPVGWERLAADGGEDLPVMD